MDLVLGEQGLQGVTQLLSNADHSGADGCGVDGAVAICNTKACLQSSLGAAISCSQLQVQEPGSEISFICIKVYYP